MNRIQDLLHGRVVRHSPAPTPRRTQNGIYFPETNRRSKKFADSQVASRPLGVNRALDLLEGRVAANSTNSIPQQFKDGIFFPETTRTSTNDSPFRDDMHNDGITYGGGYVRDGPPLAPGQQGTSTHRRTLSAPRFPAEATPVDQLDISSLYLAQVDQHVGANQRIESSPMRGFTQILSPVRELQVNEGSIDTQNNQDTQEANDENAQRKGTPLALLSSPFAPRTPDNVSDVGANLVTQNQPSMTVSSEATSLHTKGNRPLSRWEKEIASYNKEGLNERDMEPELVQETFGETGIRRIRSKITRVTALAKGETPPTPKNLALNNLFPSTEETEEQTQGGADDDTETSDAFHTEDMEHDTESDEEMGYEEDMKVSSRRTKHSKRSITYHQTSARTSAGAAVSLAQDLGGIIDGSGVAGVHSDPASRSRPAMQPEKLGPRSSSKRETQSRTTENGIVSVGSSAASSPAEPRAGSAGGWRGWEIRKDKIHDILATPGYSLPSEAYDDTSTEYSWTMKSGIHVFEPTCAEFNDFVTFLKVVEEIAGREAGVVKVVVPPLMVPPINEDVGFSTKQLVPALRFDMCTLKTTLDSKVVYKVNTTRHGFESADPRVIEEYNSTISEIWNLVTSQGPQLQKEASFRTMLMEKNMGDRLESGIVGSTDLDESLELRQSLQIQDLKLSKLPGNRLLESSSIVPGVQSSKISFCHTEGVPVVMHCKHDATYSLNYLHKGAPICWTIVKPHDHMDLEGMVHILTAGQKPKFPPECDQFVGHQGLYLPLKTLDEMGLKWKQVVQHPNEMIITFPFAYRQGFNSGPNITEEISYASNRWEIFVKEDLYRQCLPSCPGGGSRMDLSFVNASQGRLLGHKRTSTADQTTPSKKSRSDNVDSPHSKKIATPRGGPSGRGSKKKQAASSTCNTTRLRRNPTPTPNREAIENKEILEDVGKLLTNYKPKDK